MSRVDYSYKSYVLKEHGDLLSSIKKANMLDYANKVFDDNGVITYTYLHNNGLGSLDLREDAFKKGLHREWFECQKIIKADQIRRSRLRKRIDQIINSGPSLFLTLTFDDKKGFKDTTMQQRRVAVSRYLKSYGVPYVANIDFGKDKGREHYHAVIGIGRISHKEWFDKYGTIKARKIKVSDVSKTCLAKYITKLTNHAIKDTTKRVALLYSR